MEKGGRNTRWGAISALLGVGLLAAILAGAPFIGNWISEKRQASAYVGTVIKKTPVLRQSKYGTNARFLLVVRTDDGREFTTPVPPAVYERASVGSTIRKAAGDSFPTVVQRP